MLRIQEAKPTTNWESRGCKKPKPDSRQKPQSQKATCQRETGSAEDAKSQFCGMNPIKAAKAKQRGTANAEDAK